MICQPAWQLPIRQGLPSASGCSAATSSTNRASASADILDGLAGHRLRQEADEIAGMSRLKRDADLAVMLHAADAGPVAGARIENDEGPLAWIDDAFRRNDPHQGIIHRAWRVRPSSTSSASKVRHGAPCAHCARDSCCRADAAHREAEWSAASIQPVFYRSGRARERKQV